jgi:hypothetical protein
MRVTPLALALTAMGVLVSAQNAYGACAQKRSRDPSFIELAVAEGALRPTGPADFQFITDETTVDALIARVGPPDASQGTRITRLIWCFADSTELWVDTRDRVVIESARHKGKEFFRRGKKSPAAPRP